MVVYVGHITIGMLSNSHLDSTQFTAAHWKKRTPFQPCAIIFAQLLACAVAFLARGAQS